MPHCAVAERSAALNRYSGREEKGRSDRSDPDFSFVDCLIKVQICPMRKEDMETLVVSFTGPSRTAGGPGPVDHLISTRRRTPSGDP